jgi:hypothetical protein
MPISDRARLRRGVSKGSQDSATTTTFVEKQHTGICGYEFYLRFYSARSTSSKFFLTNFDASSRPFWTTSVWFTNPTLT